MSAEEEEEEDVNVPVKREEPTKWSQESISTISGTSCALPVFCLHCSMFTFHSWPSCSTKGIGGLVLESLYIHCLGSLVAGERRETLLSTI